MNNNKNFNGQYSGWGQNAGQYARYPYANNGFKPFGAPFIDFNEKNKDKKILRTMGNLFGGAVILYILLSFSVVFFVLLLKNIFPNVNMIFEDRLMSDAYSAIASILFVGGPFILVYVILRIKKYSGILPLGTSYNKKAAIYIVMMMLPVVLITSMIVNSFSFFIQQIMGISFTSGFEDMSVNGVGQVLMNVVSLAVVPAIVEEIAIRGVLLQPLRRYGDKFAIIASALIFSLLHGNMVQIPYTLFVGIYLGAVAVATGSIWPTIVLHFFNNFFSTVILAVSGNFGDKTANVVTFIMLGIIIVVGIVGAILFFTMRYRVKFEKGANTLKTGEKFSALFVNAPMIVAMIIMVVLTATSVSFNG